MKVSREFLQAQPLAQAIYEERIGRPALAPGPMSPIRIVPCRPRDWWFTERMGVNWIRFFAVVGGFLVPICLFGYSIDPYNSDLAPLLVILGLVLIGLAIYAFSETKFIDEEEIRSVSAGARTAASVVVVPGIIVAGLFALSIILCLLVLGVIAGD